MNGVRQERVASDGGIYMMPQPSIESIDRIEVIRGPMSVLYGTGAFFGVINIITNETVEEDDRMWAASYGNLDTKRIGFRGGFEVGDAKFVANFGHYDTGGPDEPYSRMTTMDLSELGVRSDTTDGRWGERRNFFNLSGSYKNFYANATFNYADRGTDVFFPAAEEGASSTGSYTSWSIGYTNELSDKFSIDSKFTYHKGATRTDFDWFTEVGAPNIGGDHNHLEDWEVDLTLFYNPSDRVSITGGLYYKQRLYEQLLTFIPNIDFAYRITLDEPSEQQAVFSQADFQATDRLKFTVGLRADQAKEYETYYTVFTGDAPFPIWYGTYTNDDVELLPRFAAIFKASDTNIFKFFYGEAINHPSIYQTASQAPAGQPSIGPEFITTYEINHLLAIGKLSFNSSIFYNELDDLIITEPILIDGAFIGVTRNGGRLTTTGAEITVKAVPSEHFQFELSGSYQTTDNESAGLENFDVPYSPEVLAYLKGSYTFGQGDSASLVSRYVSEMETLYDLTIPGRIAEGTDSYFLVDANLHLSNLFGKSYFMNLNVNNLLDEDYLYPSYTLNGNWADKGLIGDPRRIMLTVGRKF